MWNLLKQTTRVILGVICAQSALAQTVYVSNTNDSGPGSLRAALIQAQQPRQLRGMSHYTRGGTIVIRAKGRISLRSCLPKLVGTTHIRGGDVEIDGSRVSGCPVLHMDFQLGSKEYRAGRSSLNDLSVIGGETGILADGAGDPNGVQVGMILLRGVKVLDNGPPNPGVSGPMAAGIHAGPGVYMTIENSELTGNVGSRDTGTIHAGWYTEIFNTLVMDNEAHNQSAPFDDAPSAGAVAALVKGSTLVIGDTKMSHNEGGAGAIAMKEGVLALSRSVIRSNEGSEVNALYVANPTPVSQSRQHTVWSYMSETKVVDNMGSPDTLSGSKYGYPFAVFDSVVDGHCDLSLTGARNVYAHLSCQGMQGFYRP